MQSEKDKGGVLPRVERYFTDFPLTIFSKKQKTTLNLIQGFVANLFYSFLEEKVGHKVLQLTQWRFCLFRP
jgi:hypothetical protein